jgi:hypothetical protein
MVACRRKIGLMAPPRRVRGRQHTLSGLAKDLMSVLALCFTVTRAISVMTPGLSSSILR